MRDGRAKKSKTAEQKSNKKYAVVERKNARRLSTNMQDGRAKAKHKMRDGLCSEAAFLDKPETGLRVGNGTVLKRGR
jgi:hypothetical protein